MSSGAGADRLLLVSGNEPGQRVVHHANVIGAARMAGVSRIVFTSMLNADRISSPIAGDYRDSERALREAGVPFTMMRNGLYTERYTDHLSGYLEAGEIMGVGGNGRISAASRREYAAAAAAAILRDETGNRTYELGGPAFGLPKLARVISEVTGAKVTYRDLPAEEYAQALERAGLMRRPPASWPPSTPRSPAMNSRPPARTWRTCLGGRLRVSPRSCARHTSASAWCGQGSGPHNQLVIVVRG